MGSEIQQMLDFVHKVTWMPRKRIPVAAHHPTAVQPKEVNRLPIVGPPWNVHLRRHSIGSAVSSKEATLFVLVDSRSSEVAEAQIILPI